MKIKISKGRDLFPSTIGWITISIDSGHSITLKGKTLREILKNETNKE